ncbi:MAG: PDZ domain-containing protein [Lachnospiraceae bacterium]|nr:PDZ domain-containing protein [Lachnospiraceae bacterium]
MKKEEKPQEAEKKEQNRQATDYDFIREQIKERPVNRKKLIRRTLLTAGMAVLFGLIACITFLLLEPVFSKLLSSGEETELKVVSLPEQAVEEEPVQASVIPADEEEPEQIVIETPIENMSLNDEDVVSGNGTAESSASLNQAEVAANVPLIPEDTIIYETVPLEPEDYRLLYRKLYALSEEVQKSQVVVTGVHADMDWLNEPYMSTQQTMGLIIAENGYELLILADSKKLTGAESIRVTFCDGSSGELQEKSVDSDTGLGVYAIRLLSVGVSTREKIAVAVLGTSYVSSILGNAVMAVGNPLGSTSICYGAVTSMGTTVSMRDAVYQILTTDIYGSKNASGILVNMRGQVVGIICQDYNAEGMENMIHAYGISSVRKMIENMSNDVERPYLGLRIMDVTQEAAKELNLPQGVYVSQVELDSPAMSAGLAKGDIIQKIGGSQTQTVSEYMNALQGRQAGDVVEVSYARLSGTEYRTMEVTITLGVLE